MTILDILTVIDEETAVNVWRDGEIIATYDGRDSIPEELNTAEVKSVSAGHYLLTIEA